MFDAPLPLSYVYLESVDRPICGSGVEVQRVGLCHGGG